MNQSQKSYSLENFGFVMDLISVVFEIQDITLSTSDRRNWPRRENPENSF